MSFLNGTDPGLRQTRTPTTDNFAAGVDFTAGSTTQLTLSADPGSEDNVEITFDGIQQHRNTYSVSGTTVTFDAAIGSGVSNVEATFTTTIPATQPADGSVGADQLSMGVGTSANNLVQLDGSARLPAVDGSQLTGLTSAAWEVVSTTDVTSSTANVDITFTPSDADRWWIVIDGLRSVTDDVSCWMRLSTDGGSSFAAGGYRDVRHGYRSGNAEHANVQSVAGQFILDMGSTNYKIANSTARMAGFNIYFTTPSDAVTHPLFQWNSGYEPTSGDAFILHGAGYLNSPEDTDAVRFLMSSGNIAAGRFTLLKLVHG